MTALEASMQPITSCSLARQFSPEPVSAELDELFTLLRSHSTSTKQRALDIIAQQSPEDLFIFMQQLLQHPGTVPCLPAPCSGSYTALDAIEEAPDSPKRLAAATDQMMLSPSRSSSKVNNAHRDFDTLTRGDVLQLPDSPVQRLRGDHGPCDSRLLQSLDLNLGASFDLLSKASLADFSSAAAAAAASRMSTTALVRQSHMRVLSPVAESSFMSAADAQQEVSMDNSEGTSELPAGTQQCLYSSSTSSHQQQRLSDGYSFSTHTPGVKAPDAADAELSPSTCSSPRDPAAGAAAGAASALRMSVAESAHDWPSSLPLPLAVLDAETEPAGGVSVAAVQAPVQPAAAGRAPAAAAHTPALAGTPARTVPQAVQPQHSVLSTPSSTATAGAAAKTDSTSSTPKRGGGPNPLGLITAPIHGANALRRSITRLWGGNKGTNKAKAPATAAPPTKHAPRSLACASAPTSAIYGGASSSSKLPSFKQSSSPALRQPLQGFGVTQQGSSPTKAAAAAVAAFAATSSKKAAASAAHTPQRTGGNIGYRPPSSAGRGTPTAAAATPLGSTAASAGVTSRIPGSAGSSSGYSRAGSTGPSSRQQSTVQQRVQYGLDRPSSQASNMSYARSDASLTGTGSHTSAGPFQGGFQATRQALQGKATPTLKQPASRLQHKQQLTRAVSNTAATVAAAQAGSGSRGIRGPGGVSGNPGGQQGVPGFSRQAMTAAGHQLQQGRSQLPQVPSGGQSGGSRIGGGGRSQLRRSRSCGSLAEMLNVAELRSMWQQREQETTAHRQTAAAAAGAAAKHGLRHQQGAFSGGGSAAAALQGQSSIGRGTGSRQQQLGSKPTSYQPPSRVPAAAATAGAEDEGGLPVLSRCQTPTRIYGQDRSQGVGTSQVLAEMGHVLSLMDALIAGDTTSTAAPTSGSAAGQVPQPAGSGGSWGSGLEPRQQPGALGWGQSPSALVYKLVKGANAGSATVTPAADRRAVHAAGGLAHGTQQMLLTPPATLPATADDVNPVASPDESPTVSGGSSQVSHGGLPRWNVYSAPPAAKVTAGSAASSSQELLMSQEGQDLSRQLF